MHFNHREGGEGGGGVVVEAAGRVWVWMCFLADGAESNGDGPIATSQWSGYIRAGSGL